MEEPRHQLVRCESDETGYRKRSLVKLSISAVTQDQFAASLFDDWIGQTIARFEQDNRFIIFQSTEKSPL